MPEDTTEQVVVVETPGEPVVEVQETAGTETKPEDVSRLKETLAKVRKERDTLEKQLKSQPKPDKTQEERLRELENTIRDQQIEIAQTREIENAITALGDEYSVSRSDVLDMLEEMRGTLTTENVAAKVTKIVTKLRQPATAKPAPVKQERSDTPDAQKPKTFADLPSLSDAFQMK